ncbi:phosphoadenosine phosphosulfate reductase [Vibrio phage K63]
MDTGAEHPKTYEFVRKLVDVFGVDLVCLRGKFDQPLGKGVEYEVVGLNDLKFDLEPFKGMIKKYGVPYIGGMFCTDRMKLQPFKKYCKGHVGKDYETWLGIRIDEPKRLREKKGIKYLAEICDDEKQDIVSWWSEQIFDLEIPEWLGNCVFCPKKSNLKLAAAQRDEPELYIEWLNMIYSDDVRHDDNTGHWSQMYRGKKSLEQVVAMFDGSTGDEIKSRIRGAKMTDTNSCSESCEVFVCEANQGDLFK